MSKHPYVDSSFIGAVIYSIVFALLVIATIAFAIVGIWSEEVKFGYTAMVTGTLGCLAAPGFFVWAVDEL